MERTEPRDHDAKQQSPRGRAAPSPSSAAASIEEPSAIGRDCKKCLAYLTRALDRTGSRPQSLLRALGVVSHGGSANSNGANGDGGEGRLYETTEGGRGVLIRLDNRRKEEEASAAVENSAPLQTLKGNDNAISDKVPPAASVETNGVANPNDGSVTLGRRFTNAATLLAEGIRHSAEDMLNDASSISTGGVLTTSPAVEPSQQLDKVDGTGGDVTTIAIECTTCGSDTRAEAGARAFVRGPDPLSIVLCSNRLSSQREVDEVLVHELVHIYDVHSRQMDLRDCKQLAYSEVRAAREAECSHSLTSFTANICAKDKATVATRNMFPDEGRRCVCEVFDEAMRDLAPVVGGADGKGNASFLTAGCAKGSGGSSNESSDSRERAGPGPPISAPRWSDR